MRLAPLLNKKVKERAFAFTFLLLGQMTSARARHNVWCALGEALNAHLGTWPPVNPDIGVGVLSLRCGVIVSNAMPQTGQGERQIKINSAAQDR